MEHLDGNAAAGELSEVFALDVTTAIGDLRRLRRRPARRRRATSTRPAWAPSCAARRATPCCCASCTRAARAARGDARRQGAALANRAAMTRSALPSQDRRRPSPGSARAARRASGLRSAADSTPPSVGLMKPSRSEPIATCSGPIASMWRASTVERLVERLRVRAAHAVVDLVLGEDQPDHAAAGGDLDDRPVGEVVLLAAEAVAGVGGDHRVVARVARRSRCRAPRRARTSRRSRPRACG